MEAHPSRLSGAAVPPHAAEGRLWIVIVNFRTASLVEDCLRSLRSEALALDCRVVVVDNDSADGSYARLATCVQNQGWQDWVQVLAAPRNGGFAYGNNQGIRHALACDPGLGQVLLLNPDTVVEARALSALLDWMASHPRTGIVGSRLLNAEGGVEVSAHRHPSALGELEGSARLGLVSRALAAFQVSPPASATPQRCDWVSGASLMVRRAALDQVGPLDEGYFLYFEEVDFCLRVQQAGWECWCIPASRVVHLEGAATGIRKTAARRARYWYDSRRRFFVKHHGVAGLMLADLLWALGRASLNLRRLLHLGGGDPAADPLHFMYDLLWPDLRALLDGSWRTARVAEKTW